MYASAGNSRGQSGTSFLSGIDSDDCTASAGQGAAPLYFTKITSVDFKMAMVSAKTGYVYGNAEFP